MRKWLLSMSALVLLGTAVPGGAAKAQDETELWVSEQLLEYFAADSRDHWSSDVLTDMIQADVLKGYNEDDEKYIRPNGTVTRAEFVTLLLRAVDVKTEGGQAPFTDIDSKDWYYDAINTASQLGIVYGKEPHRFAPNDSITRAEISAILYRFFEPTVAFEGDAVKFSDVHAHWAQSAIENISKAGIIYGYEGRFNPEDAASRAEAVSMIHRTLRNEKTKQPEETVLIERVKQLQAKTDDMFRTTDFAAAEKYFEQETTGFVQAQGLDSIQTYQDLVESGVAISNKSEGEAKYEVLYANDRYAAVKRSGLTIETILNHDGKTASTKSEPELTFLLRKLNDHWYIYGIVEDHANWMKALFGE